MKRSIMLLLAVSTLLLLGGCAIEPTYQYTRTTDGGGYYSGQSAYGHADTVIYGSGYAGPWNPWWGYYGPGWGWGGIGFGATYTYRSHHGYRHRQHRRVRHQRHSSSPAPQRSSSRPAYQPPPVRAMRHAPQRVGPVRSKNHQPTGD